MKADVQKNWFDRIEHARIDDPARCYRVLVADLVGLKFDGSGRPSPAEFEAHVRSRGAMFRAQMTGGAPSDSVPLEPGILFEYRPQLSRAEELLELTSQGQYDGVIAAATVIPEGALFAEGGVRIGSGTANMKSVSWVSGAAPLMNTPSFNSRATAQMVFKALLRVRPDLPLEQLSQRLMESRFDTGRHLRDYPTEKLEGQRFAILGYGNIGREVALIARAFGMQVAVYARARMKAWIEAEGFEFCGSIVEAAQGARFLSLHLGLGAAMEEGFVNSGAVNADVLAALAPGAMLINFDRAELVSVGDLEQALAEGRVTDVAIDADLFEDQGVLSGPLEPYLQLRQRFGERVLLLPHVAADTDHPSRVAGAVQAADQIIAAIRFGCLVNAVGAVPSGYTNLGSERIVGVGNVSASAIASFCQNGTQIAQMRQQLAVVDEWLASLGQSPVSSRHDGSEVLAAPDVQQVLLALSNLATSQRELGLAGPH